MKEREFDIQEILGTALRRWRIIATSVATASIISFVVLFSITPIYSASALIMIDPSKKNLLDPDAPISSAAADSARIDSEVELVRADTTLINVISQLNLISSEEFAPGLGIRASLMALLRIGEAALPTGDDALDQTLVKIRRAITVQRRGLTYLVTVEARSESARMAANLANAIARTYIAGQVQSKVDSLLASRSILTTRIEEARVALAQSDISVETFLQQNLERPATGEPRGDLAELQDQVDQLSSTREALATTASLVRGGLAQGDWQTIVAQLQDDALSALEQQRSSLSAQLGNVATPPIAVELLQRLADIEGQMHNTAQDRVSSLQVSIADLQKREDTLRLQLRQTLLKGDIPSEILAQLYDLQQNGQLARDQYQNLLARSQDLDAQATLQIADSRIVSPALPSSVPAFPHNTLVLVSGILGGLAVGLVLAFVYENFVGGLVSEDQLAALPDIKVAGSVPHVKTTAALDSLANQLLNAPLSGFSEAARRLQAAIDQSLENAGPRDRMAPVVMVSSAGPHEGKSTLSLALGRSYALAGRRVLLIDADLRKPTIHRHLGASPTMGLLEFLKNPQADATEINDILVRETSGLELMLGAQRSDIPTDRLLTQDSFKRLILAARRAYEIVIIDTPPVGPVVDAVHIARHASAVLFVCKWASTTPNEVRRAISMLKGAAGEATPHLAVLNGVPASQSAHYRRYQAYYAET